MFTKVENKNPYVTSREYYWHVQDNNIDYLFTESQLKTAMDRALNNPEDLPKLAPPEDCEDTFSSGFYIGFLSGGLATVLAYFILRQFV